jgi:hypothetical protein
MAPTIWYAGFRLFSAPAAILYATGLTGDEIPGWTQALIGLYSLGSMILAGAATWWLWKKVRRSWPFASAEPQRLPPEAA